MFHVEHWAQMAAIFQASLSHSILSATLCATSSPHHFASSASAKSIPAETPAEVATRSSDYHANAFFHVDAPVFSQHFQPIEVRSRALILEHASRRQHQRASADGS